MSLLELRSFWCVGVLHGSLLEQSMHGAQTLAAADMLTPFFVLTQASTLIPSITNALVDGVTARLTQSLAESLTIDLGTSLQSVAWWMQYT